MAEVSGLALAPAVVRLAQHGHAARDELAVREALLQALPDVLFDAVHLEGWKQLAVGKLREARILSAHPDERLDAVVPGLDVLVADGPVDTDALLLVCIEVQVAPAEAVARPQQGAPAHLVAPEPAEVLHRVVRMVFVLDEEVLGVLPEQVEVLLDGIVLEVLRRRLVPVRQLPGNERRCRVVFDVLDVAAALENQGPQTGFRQLLGGPAAGDAGTHDDRVVRVLGLSRSGSAHDVAHPFCPGTRSTHPRYSPGTAA